MISRSLLMVLFTAGLAVAAEPKPGQIVVSDPAQLKQQPDYAVQGEYTGEVDIDGTKQALGVQIIAKGDGNFVGKAFFGGLPGGGWNGETVMEGTVVREGDKVVVKDDTGTVRGEIADGMITLTDDISGTLKRVVRTSPTLGAKPPEGATVLFGGPDDVTNWDGGKVVELSDGKYLGVGTRSKMTFDKPFTLHLEFRTPYMPTASGQGRGNSGVYIQDRYELQVLDSFGLAGKDNECGGIYKESAPKVNMCLPPMQWQTYDIDFTPATFDEAGKKKDQAVITVKHNGVVIHDQLKLKSNTPGGKFKTEVPEGGALYFQNHGNPVVFNNVWVVEK